MDNWLDCNILEGLTVFAFSEDHWRWICTINYLERVSQEIRRRTRAAGIFPNEAACIRLVSALLMEIGETWETGRIYLSWKGSEVFENRPLDYLYRKDLPLSYSSKSVGTQP